MLRVNLFGGSLFGVTRMPNGDPDRRTGFYMNILHPGHPFLPCFDLYHKNSKNWDTLNY